MVSASTNLYVFDSAVTSRLLKKLVLSLVYIIVCTVTFAIPKAYIAVDSAITNTNTAKAIFIASIAFSIST